MPYGDQALFMRAETFRGLGGFEESSVMEDYAMVRRLRRRGVIAIVDAAVVSSGRFWEKFGVWGATWRNRVTVMGWHVGVPRAWLARLRRAPLRGSR